MSPSEFQDRFLPEVTVDVALLTVGADGVLRTLLARRAEAPFLGSYALPGVFVGRAESLEAAAERALRDKVNVSRVRVEQLFTFGGVDRDPRGRIVSVAYYALVPEGCLTTAALRGPHSIIVKLDVPWADERGAGAIAFDEAGNRLNVAFDHDRIIGLAVARIRGKLNYAPIGFELLPDRFTLFQLQRIHEGVLGRKLNKDSFRRRIISSGLVEDTRERLTDRPYRPAALYRFKKAS